MVFWIGLLVAALFALFCIRRGLYDSWSFAFNSIIAIYAAIFAEPQISQLIPMAGQTPLGDMLIVAGTAVIVFFILQGISHTFVTGHFTIYFPKILDVSGAGLLGLLIGAVIWNFGVFVVCNMPVFPDDLAEQISYTDKTQQAGITVFSVPCNMVNMIVSRDSSRTTQQAAEELLKKIAKREEERTSSRYPIPPPSEPNRPQKPVDERDLLGPPPEMESQGG